MSYGDVRRTEFTTGLLILNLQIRYELPHKKSCAGAAGEEERHLNVQKEPKETMGELNFAKIAEIQKYHRIKPVESIAS
jgi:hypothetical protein